MLSTTGGEIPRIATKAIRFVNVETGELSSTTDLAIKKLYRRKALRGFHDAYIRLLNSKHITIMLIVASVEKYKTVSGFMKDFKDSLSRKNIDVYGYYWQRDIGDIQFNRHFHIMVAVSRIAPDLFNALYKNKKNKNYKVMLCNTITGFKNYLEEKEMYAPPNHRAYGKSQQYKKPIKAHAI